MDEIEREPNAPKTPKKWLDMNSELGMTRRDLIRRGAIVGGTLLWAAPAIQSITTPASAHISATGSANFACCWCVTNPANRNQLTTDGGPAGPIDPTTPWLSSASDCDAHCQSRATDLGVTHVTSEYHAGPTPISGDPVNGCGPH